QNPPEVGSTVKVHPCGHVARLGPRLMCRHLMGEDGLRHDYVHLLTGRGMEYHLCCEDCDKSREAGVETALLGACEGCVERIDDPGKHSMVGWRVAGAPGPVWALLPFDGRVVRYDAATGDHAELARVRLPAEEGEAWNGRE